MLAEFAIPPQRQMPRDLWRWRVNAQHVANLSDPARLAAVGLTPPHPAQREWPAFQRIGQDLWRAGYSGVLAPSAAREDSLVLCLFREHDEIASATPYARRRPTAMRPRHPPA